MLNIVITFTRAKTMGKSQIINNPNLIFTLFNMRRVLKLNIINMNNTL